MMTLFSSEEQESFITTYNNPVEIKVRYPMRIVNTDKLIPKGIVIHETANFNSYANAEWHSHYLDTTTRKVVWHYTVDDKTIINTYPDTLQGWHAGRCNYNTLGIEICVYEGIDRTKAIANTQTLIRQLRERQPDLWIQKHRDCAKTLCPGTISDAEWRNFLLTL